MTKLPIMYDKTKAVHMPRPTDNPKSERIIFRTTPELKSAVRSLAEDLDTSISEAASRAIEYGILYYYYNKDSESDVNK